MDFKKELVKLLSAVTKLKEIENLIYKIHLSYQLKNDIDKDYIKKIIYVHMMDSIS